MLDIQSRGLCLVHEAKDEISALPLCLALIKKSMNSRVGSVEACAVLLLHISEELPKEIGWYVLVFFVNLIDLCTP
jgi:hypothetical protein